MAQCSKKGRCTASAHGPIVAAETARAWGGWRLAEPRRFAPQARTCAPPQSTPIKRRIARATPGVEPSMLG
jgi:hypothetical protein